MVGAGRVWDPFVWIRPATNIPFMQDGCPSRDTGAPHDQRGLIPSGGNPEAPHIQNGDTPVVANVTQRQRDAQKGMKLTQSRDLIVRIRPTAREAHKRSGWPPRSAGTPQGRSRGLPMGPNTPHNRADTASGTEARRHRAIARGKLRRHRRRRSKVHRHKRSSRVSG